MTWNGPIVVYCAHIAHFSRYFAMVPRLHAKVTTPHLVPGDRVAVAWVEGVLRRVRAVAIPLADIPAPADHPRPVVASAGTPSEQGGTREPAPDLKLVSLDGDEVSLASLRGRAVLLNIWATWCVPCIREMPELAALHERRGKDARSYHARVIMDSWWWG